MPELSMASEGPDSFPPVELQLFIHQVGGHTSMFRFNETTVCKPLCVREYQFYTSLPEEIRQFTAECRGVVEVEVCQCADGTAQLLAHPVEGPGGDWVRANSKCISHQTRHRTERAQNGGDTLPEEAMINVNRHADNDVKQNPWVENIYQRQLTKLCKDNKFILLENMVAQFVQPCVLDLKMGTRQYGDDSSPEKRALLIQRCKDSTTASFGVRCCGMQVYQGDVNEYMFYDKYHGRTMDVEGFKEMLYQFLHNGHRLRVDLLTEILDKLRRLHRIISKQQTFRFFSSSLLILYDGTLGLNTSTPDPLVRAAVRDNGLCAGPSNGAPLSSPGNSGRILFDKDIDQLSKVKTSQGLGCSNSSSDKSSHLESTVACDCSNVDHTVVNQPVELTENGNTEEVDGSRDNCVRGANLGQSYASDTGETESLHAGAVPSSIDGTVLQPKVEVRMVDFAHSTFQDFTSNDKNHTGPDQGYLFGLGNLIDSFEEMKKKYVSVKM